METMSKDHAYRKGVHTKDLISFRVLIKETDLSISASRDLSKQASDSVFHYRRQLEDYIKAKPGFLSSLLPYAEDPFAPEIIKEMISATRIFHVGPMAAVAGTIAQLVGRDLLQFTDELIVENGGDIFLKTDRPIKVAIFAGNSTLSDKLGIIIYPEQMPAGICTSSATVGHSLSLGSADSVCILSSKASIADAAATSLGNKITNQSKLEKEIKSMKGFKDIKGGVVIIGKIMASWGEIELTTLQ